MDKSLQDTIANMQGKRIAVVGDLMLDRYIRGNVYRISPEAPIPVVEEFEKSECLGGAANVMRNIITLGGQVYAFGVIGNDTEGESLLTYLKSYKININGIQKDTSRCTTIKTRILAGSQQLLRIDREKSSQISENLQCAIANGVKELLREKAVDALVLEDYAKGVLTQNLVQQLVDEANRVRVITLLDPNPKNRICIKGLTLLKPNRKEAYLMAGTRPWSTPIAEIAETLKRLWKPENLVISLSQDGMQLYESNGKVTHIPTEAKEVYDVSGAGDTVLAATALAMAGGASVPEAIKLGNIAAGIVVGKIGTAMVSADEILHSKLSSFEK